METVKVKKTAEETAELRKKNKEVADTYAREKGAEDITDITDPIRTKLESKDPVVRQMGKAAAAQAITDLAQLILYQEIDTMALPSTYDLVEKTNDGVIANGNAKEYMVDLVTGNTVYNEANFNPDKQTLKQLNSYIIQMYDKGGALNAKAFQWQKELTIPQGKYIPYFLSGKLNELLNNLRAQIYKALKIFLSNKLFSLITTTEYNKTITGTADNLFDSLVSEVIPNINKMQLLNNEYNAAETDFIDTVDPSNILVIMSNKNKTLIENGIKTQLYNANLLSANGKTLKPENIICLGNQLTLGDQDEILVDTKKEWLDDNTIIVIDITNFKTVYQLNEAASQFYARNLTLYLTLHVWGAMDILPWCKAFKYTNPNLSKLPE